MKKVVIELPVEMALRTLDAKDRRKVQAWLDRLKNWDGDEYVRSHSHRLDSIPNVCVLKTNTDLRVFFTIEGDTVIIRDVATKRSILMSGGISEVG